MGYKRAKIEPYFVGYESISYPSDHQQAILYSSNIQRLRNRLINKNKVNKFINLVFIPPTNPFKFTLYYLFDLRKEKQVNFIKEVL